MGTVAATVSRAQLTTGPFTHVAVNRALTSGFSSAFEVAALFAAGGFVAALIAVRNPQAPAGSTLEVDDDRLRHLNRDRTKEVLR
jgi:hypothetical protein